MKVTIKELPTNWRDQYDNIGNSQEGKAWAKKDGKEFEISFN